MPKRQWSSNYCLACDNFNWKKYGTCKAFPDGVPFIIVSGQRNHFVKLEGQLNDFVYKEKEKK